MTELENIKTFYEKQIKELCLQRNKLEAQMKFGLDSFKMEQERADRLEKELGKFVANQVSQC